MIRLDPELVYRWTGGQVAESAALGKVVGPIVSRRFEVAVPSPECGVQFATRWLWIYVAFPQIGPPRKLTDFDRQVFDTSDFGPRKKTAKR